jgi:hypothetical protein
MSGKPLTILATGDLIISRWPADALFALVAPVLNSADVVIGHGETVFTTRGVATYADMSLLNIAAGGNGAPVGFPGCDPRSISALSASGFHVITLAHNHIWDAGLPGIEDTIAGLKDCGIACCGAGMNLDEARRPAIIARDGTRFGFLSYNCVGPKGTWALSNKPGCAYIHIVTAYDSDVPAVNYPMTYTFAEPTSLKAMVDDIGKLRPFCDVLVVSLHKGLGYIPARLAMYEQAVSYAAIDAGADLVLGHHAHILKGIEQYKGKWIFHGLANFVFGMPEGLVQTRGPDWKEAFVTAHGGPFFFERGGLETPFASFPERMMTIIAKCTVSYGQISQASYLPCWINKKGQPEILKNDERGQQVFAYMDNITKGAGLNARYDWKKDEVILHSD